MCNTNAFVVSGGSEEMLMESVARVEVKGDTLAFVSVFGDRKEIAGRITSVNFQAGKLFIETA